MAAKKTRSYTALQSDRIEADLTRSVAEDDRNLAFYYVHKERYLARALNFDDPATVFIGPKGVGKSAILQMVRLTKRATGDESRVIEIKPDDLAFKSLVNIQASSPILDRPAMYQWLFKSLWDYVLTVEIMRRERASTASFRLWLKGMFESRDQKLVTRLLNLTFDDEGKAQASLTQRMISLVEAVEVSGGVAGVAEGKVELKGNAGVETRRNMELLNLINNAAKVVREQVTHEFYVLIDDLDLHWSGSKLENAFLGAMFLSMRRIMSDHIKFVVSLRENIYDAVELEDKDKFNDAVVRMNWSRPQVKEIVASRFAFVLTCPPDRIWDGLFPSGSFERIVGVTEGFPREVIKASSLCVEAARNAGHCSVESDDIDAGLRAFGLERISDLSSQWRSEFPGLRDVLLKFRGRHKEFALDVVEDVAYACAQDVEVNPGCLNAWASGYASAPLALARILLRTKFLLLKASRSATAHSVEENQVEIAEPSHWFAIHPMYAAGLDLR